MSAAVTRRATGYSALRRLVRRGLVRRLKVVPRGATARLAAVPGLPWLLELRWARMLRRRPVITVEQYAATVELGELEELIPCPLCGGRRVQPLFDPERRGRWRYHVVRCADCGFLYRNPGIRPERLGELYSRGNYARFLTGHYARNRQDQYRAAMAAFDPLFADGHGRRLLDYGCGVGMFLEVAGKRGFDASGVDLSPDSVAEARRRGLDAWLGSPRQVPQIAEGGFDVVTLWSVLAHLPRPVEDLATLRDLLSADGVLLISTVNANSLLLKAYGRRWGGFTPNHLIFSSPTTLPMLLGKAGFEAVVSRPFYGRPVERGEVSERAERRLRRVIDQGDQGMLLRAAAFVRAETASHWGLQAAALTALRGRRGPVDPR